jgi:pyridoxamine 5'-phosphate oxidase
MRTDYRPEELRRSSLADDPFEQFTHWFEQANETKVIEPNAFSLATANSDGVPALRTVLLKYYDSDGFVFFTNYESAKAQDIAENPAVCMMFPWLAMHRQVIIKGVASKISSKDSLKYFLKRPRDSQLGAWISQQSSVISSRSVLESKLAEIKNRFSHGDISLPPFWGGFQIRPSSFEFWQGGPNRIHDRFLYQPAGDDEPWSIKRLSP